MARIKNLFRRSLLFEHKGQSLIGTVEEKIDRMLDEKADLSREVIAGSGEAWITEMDNKELMSLFQLTL